MQGGFDDRDHTEFVIHERPGQANVIVSRAAFMLHSFALVAAVRTDDPAFVSRRYLDALDVETTLTVIELETAHLWRWNANRDGYDILDDQFLKLARDAEDRVRELMRGDDPTDEESS